MKDFRVPEIVLGLLVGIILSLFVAGVSSYQTAQCERTQKAQPVTPSNEQIIPSSQQRDNGHQQIGERSVHAPYFGCGDFGFFASMVGFMDTHEGFFVGSFTFALVIATILLWRSTFSLWEAGERQIDVARISAESAKISAEITEKNFRHTHKPNLTYRLSDVPELDTEKAPTVEVELLNVGGGVYHGGYMIGFELISSEQFEAPIKIKKPSTEGMVWERNDPTPLKRTFSRKLTNKEITSIQAGKFGLNFWGYLVGKDAWGEEWASDFSYIFTEDYSNARFASRNFEIENSEEKKDEDTKSH